MSFITFSKRYVATIFTCARRTFGMLLVAALVFGMTGRSSAQSQDVALLRLPVEPSPTLSSSADTAALPNDPSASMFVGALLKTPQPGLASKYAKRIRANQTAQTIDERDKVLLGLQDLYSPFSLLGIVASAGYSHLLNGQPNYGTNGDAFAQRFGAIAVRDTTESILDDAVFAPLLHEDPRYYVQGKRYGLVHRTLYAVSRTLVTRTDHGGSSVNGALLLGYAASSALSYTYYPQINRNFHDTAATYGDSIGGAAFGFVASEFTDDVLQLLHLEKKP